MSTYADTGVKLIISISYSNNLIVDNDCADNCLRGKIILLFVVPILLAGSS
jgi:hypothetical protein